MRVCLSSLVLVLIACGGGADDPAAGTRVRGTLVLPEGSALAAGDLTVLTAGGVAEVWADGRFELTLDDVTPTHLDVFGPDGRLVMFGVARDGSAEASAATTARVLLYTALGASALPAEQAAALDTLLAGHPAMAALTATVAARIAADPGAIAAGDETLTAALAAAHRAVLPEVPSRTVAPLTAPAGATDVVLEPGGGVLQSGVAVLHNPAGAGLVAQNTFRRPGLLLAYQVAVADGAGGRVDTTPPRRVGEAIAIPATGKLELFTALGDIVTGDAPWSPVLSGAFALPLAEPDKATWYELVVLGPTLDAVTRPALLDDLRFVGEREAWEGHVGDLALELFFSELLAPLVESFAFGKVGVLEAGKRKAFVSAFKQLNDRHLAQIGVFLEAGSGYAQAMLLVLGDLATDSRYRLDFMGVVAEALGESERAKLDFDALDKKLAARASAAAILAAVQIALTSGDVAAILADLQSAQSVEGWQATATPAFVRISPVTTVVHEDDPQQVFEASVRGAGAGSQWVYRWSTSGRHGYISDYLSDGTTIDTKSAEVFYQVTNPLHITDDLRDTVTVEVFPRTGDSAVIAPGTPASGRAVAEIEGRDWTLDSRLHLEECGGVAGFYRDGLLTSCAVMFLRFPKDVVAKRYTVTFEGDLGAGDLDHNSNTELARSSGFVSHTFLAEGDPLEVPYDGQCWCGRVNGAGQPSGFVLSPMAGEYWVSVYFSFEHVQYLTAVEHFHPLILPLSEQVVLFHEWLDGAVITVTKSE